MLIASGDQSVNIITHAPALGSVFMLPERLSIRCEMKKLYRVYRNLFFSFNTVLVLFCIEIVETKKIIKDAAFTRQRRAFQRYRNTAPVVNSRQFDSHRNGSFV